MRSRVKYTYTICPHCGVVIKFCFASKARRQTFTCARCRHEFEVTEKNSAASPPDEIFQLASMLMMGLGGLFLGRVIQGRGGALQAIWGFALIALSLLSELWRSLAEAAVIRELRRGR